MTEIYLCRHGRTVLNAAGVLRGRLDPDLDEVGRAQAEALAERLTGRGIEQPIRVVSSPLRRAVQTATPLAAASGVEVEIDPRLIDRAYGRYDGTPPEPLIAEFGSLDAVPGVEPSDQVRARATDAVAAWAVRALTGPVALVSHDAVLRLLLNALAPDAGIGQLETGGAVLLRRQGNRWLLVDGHDDPATMDRVS
ncbi:histidine phosphatase family protein [Micropruina sp.]|uniref:histidine phosphatase family protein n=1 Tax=Micropruina sp. TaxID=2737536 RepID=UPI0039E5F9AE